MCDLGINVENFNPRVLYTLKRKFNDESKVSYHSHDFISMIYMLSGSCIYIIDSVHYQVKKGDMIICNPGVSHGKTIGKGEEIVEFHVGLTNIHVDNLQRNHLIAKDVCPVFSLLKYDQEIFKCCSDIFLEQEKSEPGGEALLKVHVMKLVIMFLKSISTDEITRKVPDFSFENYDKASLISTLVSFINENYMKEITLDTISKNMYLSPIYISKVFKEEMGESPINYLIKVRLAKANELLTGSGLSVKAIAKEVGYNDAYHFSKLYKKYYSESPVKSKKRQLGQLEKGF